MFLIIVYGYNLSVLKVGCGFLIKCGVFTESVKNKDSVTRLFWEFVIALIKLLWGQ